MTREPITAYPGLEGELGRQIREAVVDYASFARHLSVCELGDCRASCCHDGVYLTDEEVRGIGEALGQHGGGFSSDDWAVGAKGWLDECNGRPKSVTLQAGDVAEGYPAHFPRTRCVFLDKAHRCVLQRLAVDQGKHPWFWKPLSCWMHPLVLEPGGRSERPRLTLPSRGRDPSAKPHYPGFASCTPCGMEDANGVPAWEALKRELGLLGTLGGRDLIGEIRAACE